MIHVFLGTKAEYIKTAPLLRLLDERGVPHRLVDAGQHAGLAGELRDELGVRAPDHVMGDGRDVDTIPQAIVWALRLATWLLRPARLRREVFGGHGGIVVVHGDTPSTLLATLMVRRAGLRVAHLEAGLRSHRLLHPFPEEIVRRIVMRFAHVLFAPDEVAVANLARSRVKGEVVQLSANTVAEALRHDLRVAGAPGGGPVVVTMHRVENLNRQARVAGFVALVERIAAERDVVFCVHGPTREALAGSGHLERLAALGVEVVPLRPHGAFVALLHEAAFVVTDGGSIQEECALLGVPTLLWRGSTERPDGVGRNVVLADYDQRVVDGFLADPQALRHPPVTEVFTPSVTVLEHLLAAEPDAGPHAA
jgi:UDP-N-acetylglucosamine 2-epimerase